MATSVTAAGRPGAAADANFARRLVQWAKGHRQATAYLGIVVGVGAVLFVWNLWTTRTAERAAGARLEQARLAVDSKNFRLAASELSQLVANYSGTHAAQQATILLAQVQLGQGQNQLAVDMLKRFAPDGGRGAQRRADAGGGTAVAFWPQLLRIIDVMLSWAVLECGEPPQLTTPLSTIRASPESQPSS